MQLRLELLVEHRCGAFCLCLSDFGALQCGRIFPVKLTAVAKLEVEWSYISEPKFSSVSFPPPPPHERLRAPSAVSDNQPQRGNGGRMTNTIRLWVQGLADPHSRAFRSCESRRCELDIGQTWPHLAGRQICRSKSRTAPGRGAFMDSGARSEGLPRCLCGGEWFARTLPGCR